MAQNMHLPVLKELEGEMELFQHTISKRVVLSGEGVISGKEIRVELCPAPPNHGLVFERADVEPSVSIPLSPETISASEGASLVSQNGQGILFVEHLLATLNGLAIDNLVIRVFGPEIPLFDGSARVFAEAILSAGRRPQWSLRRYLRLHEEIVITEGRSKVIFRPSPELTLSCTIEFPHPAIGKQSLFLNVNQEKFLSELSFARTFGFLEVILEKRRSGQFRGGTLENAIVLDHEKVLNPDGLRTPDEFVRHKALDLLGDLYLLGFPLLAEVEAIRSTHKLHVKALQTLFRRDFAWAWYPSPGRLPLRQEWAPSFAA